MNELTQRGISALRSGDRVSARGLFREAIRSDPDDATAWLWLTGALDQDEERIDCLKQVLRIDPNNQAAARGIAQILARQKENAQGEQIPTESPFYGQPRRVEAEEEEATVSAAEDTSAAQTTAGPAIVADLRDGFTFSENDEEREANDNTGELSGEAELVAAMPAVDLAAREDWVSEIAPHDGVFSNVVPSPAAASERRRHTRSTAEPLHTIFRTRPSQVPALLAFWFFFLGTTAVAIMLRSASELALGFSVVLGLFLMLIVVYALIRNFSVRYELTNRYLDLPFRGQKTRVAVGEITQAECRQTFLQRLIGTGDVRLKAAVKHELANLRMRNIPDCKNRVEQIHAAVSNAGGNSKP